MRNTSNGLINGYYGYIHSKVYPGFYECHLRTIKDFDRDSALDCIALKHCPTAAPFVRTKLY